MRFGRISSEIDIDVSKGCAVLPALRARGNSRNDRIAGAGKDAQGDP